MEMNQSWWRWWPRSSKRALESVCGGAMKLETKLLSVCDSCPWRISNHRRKHSAGWYTIGNLRRLWNGLRTGQAPGIICHASDPESREYGSEKTIPAASKPRECGGALIILMRHVDELNRAKTLKEYAKCNSAPITKRGLAKILERQFIGGGFPAVQIDDPSKIGLPWKD
jgi:hypothetical protein